MGNAVSGNQTDSFLYSIAKAYLLNDAENVSDYCFVFPNKRSGVFFHQAFAEASRATNIRVPHPASTTISDFIDELVPGKKAERLELIFILYQAYREVIYRHSGQDSKAQAIAEMVDFNRFQRWADMLLGDFNDVDMYLVDPEQIFPNLKRYREISVNFISPEILEEIKRHWKLEKLPDEIRELLQREGRIPADEELQDNDRFWKHIDGEDGSSAYYFRLWQVMLEVYETFRRRLESEKLFYSGMAYRTAVDIVRDRPREEFEFKRYIFVGFNMLSAAEEKIFKLMKEKRGGDDAFADFYFDNASPAFRNEGNPIATFLRRYVEKFPPRFDCVEPIEGFPRIEITGISSRIGQAKIAGGICGTLYPQKDEKYDGATLRQTAVILPQENLAPAVLAAVPQWISPVNLTMGYKLRDSRTATLVRNIVSLHLRSRKAHGTTPTFFYEDVLKVLTHPLIRQLHPKEHSRLVYEIQVNRMFNIESPFVEERFPALKPIFQYVDNPSDAREVFDYFANLFRWIAECWDKMCESSQILDASTPTPEGLQIDIDGMAEAEHANVKSSAIVDKMLTQAYIRAIDRLRSLVDKYLKNEKEIFLEDSTMFHLLERIVGGETVNFEGRPLEGLQVMGVLEARGLDFKNVILPSMNERIFPKKHYQKSFIPPHLRSAYGMSTQEHQESIYAYYFYRMISRAQRVFLLYDTRTKGLGAGQMSRYLAQLIHLYKPKELSTRVLGYKLGQREDLVPSVKKTPEIMRELARYLPSEKGKKRYLSASSINQYINCPLSFYLSYIAGYKRENEHHDYMDESTYGTIMHGVLEDLYKKLLSEHPGQRFTRQVLEGLKHRTTDIERAIRIRINRHYNLLGDKDHPRDDALHGDSEIFGRLMKKYILKVIDRDIEVGEFDFLYGEYGDPMQLELSDGQESMSINFVYSIDRVDRLWLPKDAKSDAPQESVLRVIDYKTGTDDTDIQAINDMFEQRTPSAKRRKAMLQVFLYCQALAQAQNLDEPIQPNIFLIKRVAVGGFEPLKISIKEPGAKKGKRVPIMDYRTYSQEFNKLMLNVLSDLFNPDVDFEVAKTDAPCKYCQFHEICRRNKD